MEAHEVLQKLAAAGKVIERTKARLELTKAKEAEAKEALRESGIDPPDTVEEAEALLVSCRQKMEEIVQAAEAILEEVRKLVGNE